MRLSPVCRRIVGVDKLYAESAELKPFGLVFTVRPRPSHRRARCGQCQRKAALYDRQATRYWRHLAVGATVIWLAYAPARVHCRHCGVRVESVPWARHRSRLTAPAEETLAYMAQLMDYTTITRLIGVAWTTVARCVRRVVTERLKPERLSGLRCIGIDEFSYQKRHRYLTVVVDHDCGRVVWVGRGRGADTLGEFFAALGEAECAGIEAASIDMSGGYIKACQEHIPQAVIVFDRFHVERLARDALDQVRRAEVRAIKASRYARVVKKSRYALLKNPWNLSALESDKLADIHQHNQRLYRAYLLKETLCKVFDYRQPKRARDLLEAWLSWACRSKLAPFVRISRTIRQHFDSILTYIRWRLTNGVVEGINQKARTVARRAYGYHSWEALAAMIHLCAGDVELDPLLPGPT